MSRLLRVVSITGRLSLRQMSSSTARPPFDPTEAFRYTEPPYPEWKPGDGANVDSPLANQWKEDGKVGFLEVNPENETVNHIYRLMTSGIIPRPIAFISSESKDGVQNLAPFSEFNIVMESPPLLSISLNTPSGRLKNTAANILATKQFTVNIISEPFTQAANWCSIDTPPDKSEWIGSGLTKEPSSFVKPPRVKESAFSMECELYQQIPISTGPSPSENTTILILGLIKRFHIRKDVLTPARDNQGPGLIDPIKLRAVSRLGGITYARIGEAFEVKRPKWKNEEEEYNKLEKEGRGSKL